MLLSLMEQGRTISSSQRRRLSLFQSVSSVLLHEIFFNLNFIEIRTFSISLRTWQKTCKIGERVTCSNAAAVLPKKSFPLLAKPSN